MRKFSGSAKFPASDSPATSLQSYTFREHRVGLTTHVEAVAVLLDLMDLVVSFQ
jgi:hypothetical protein